jgi:hypothetical protein
VKHRDWSPAAELIWSSGILSSLLIVSAGGNRSAGPRSTSTDTRRIKVSMPQTSLTVIGTHPSPTPGCLSSPSWSHLNRPSRRAMPFRADMFHVKRSHLRRRGPDASGHSRQQLSEEKLPAVSTPAWCLHCGLRRRSSLTNGYQLDSDPEREAHTLIVSSRRCPRDEAGGGPGRWPAGDPPSGTRVLTPPVGPCST